MRTQRVVLALVTGLATVATLFLGVTPAAAYSQWSFSNGDPSCQECHGDFRSNTYISPVDGQLWGNLHNIHRNTMLDGDCDTCHQASDEFPVILNDSAGGTGFESIGCMGCHGVDPGTAEPHWGAGLRLHHTNADVPADNGGLGDTCVDCHTDDPVPAGENTSPSYYFTPDAAHPDKPNDPCNPSPDFPENFAGFTLGMDNDGDLAYDEMDSDCGSVEIFADGFESGDSSAWSVVTP